VKREFDQVKSDLDTQSRRIIDSATQQLRAQESDDELKKRADAQLALLQVDALGRVEEQHRRSLQRHATEANQKYNELVLNATRREDEPKRKWDGELSALHKTIADGHRSAANQLANEQRELEGEKDSILASIGDMETQMLKQQNEAELYLKAAASHRLAMRDLQDQFDVRRRQYEEGRRRRIITGRCPSCRARSTRRKAPTSGRW
jgi:hypothetical protein